jgi:gluconate 2-dehydrogenase gamma chain
MQMSEARSNAQPVARTESPSTRMTDEQIHERLVARILSRRRFLGTTAIGGLAATAVAASSQISAAPTQPSATGPGGPSMQQDPNGSSGAQGSSQSVAGFEFFSPFQADIVAAAAARLIPTDDNGPGATEAGVVYFIDRQLSSDYGMTGRRYVHGPFMTGTATQGDQSGLDMRDRYRLGIQGMDDYAQQLYQQGFVACSPDQRDRILSDMQAGLPRTFGATSIQALPSQAGSSGTEAATRAPTSPGMQIGPAAFFTLLLQHVIAGFFADPVHGGNRDFVGWKLIGFPGAQLSYSQHISGYGQPWTGGYKSLAEYQGPFSMQHI